MKKSVCQFSSRGKWGRQSPLLLVILVYSRCCWCSVATFCHAQAHSCCGNSYFSLS